MDPIIKIETFIGFGFPVLPDSLNLLIQGARCDMPNIFSELLKKYFFNNEKFHTKCLLTDPISCCLGENGPLIQPSF